MRSTRSFRLPQRAWLVNSKKPVYSFPSQKMIPILQVRFSKVLHSILPALFCTLYNSRFCSLLYESQHTDPFSIMGLNKDKGCFPARLWFQDFIFNWLGFCMSISAEFYYKSPVMNITIYFHSGNSGESYLRYFGGVLKSLSLSTESKAI